jgi:hypothetical protein
MASTSVARKRGRGEIETLPNGSLRVRVYAGIDPVSKKKHYLVETVPSGPAAAREAEKVRTRLLAHVDERRNRRTRATLNRLLARFWEVVELKPTTRRGCIAENRMTCSPEAWPDARAVLASMSRPVPCLASASASSPRAPQHRISA